VGIDQLLKMNRMMAHLDAADRELNSIDPIHLPLRESQLFGRAQFKLADAINAIHVFLEIRDAPVRDELKMPVDEGPKNDE
jgi:hypothetical protein|tara:strand:+ start:2057 stop:2299 length:243 start_codon:yes stop_codon:yes gene_type:complete